MSGFSPDWLALREPVDHRSRDPRLAERLRSRFARHTSVNVADLGCGTGSNLRGTFHLLPDEQHWTLVDYDARLLAAARQAIAGWADASEAAPPASGDDLAVRKGGKRLRIRLRQADLNAVLDTALGSPLDLVTASAFFDLCSTDFIGRLAAAVAARRAVFFTVLTYNGEQAWQPSHKADEAMLAAFVRHQGGDKGFGPSAGPAAPAALRSAYGLAGYAVHEADSPWRLAKGDERLIGDLASGFAAAVAERSEVDAEVIAEWSSVERTAAVVGHTDTLAVPR